MNPPAADRKTNVRRKTVVLNSIKAQFAPVASEHRQSLCTPTAFHAMLVHVIPDGTPMPNQILCGCQPRGPGWRLTP